MDLFHVLTMLGGLSLFLFGMMEMISRIRAVLRRAKPISAPRLLQSGALELNETRHEVRLHGKSIELTRKEYDLPLPDHLDRSGRCCPLRLRR